MRYDEDKNVYAAETNNFIVRTIDNFIMGEDFCLDSSDNIENYSEVPYNRQSYFDFYLNCGYNEEEIEERWTRNHQSKYLK